MSIIIVGVGPAEFDGKEVPMSRDSFPSSPGLSGCENCHLPKCETVRLTGSESQCAAPLHKRPCGARYGRNSSHLVLPSGFSERVRTVQPARLWNCRSAFAQISISANCKHELRHRRCRRLCQRNVLFGSSSESVHLDQLNSLYVSWTDFMAIWFS